MHDLTEDPNCVSWLGVLYKTILSPEDSGGGLSILDCLTPLGSGPPRHIHHAEDKVFVILTGQCRFWVAGQEFMRGPGDAVFIPRGTEHAFKVVGRDDCRHLMIITPGGVEGFFDEMAAGQFAMPADLRIVRASARRHNMTLSGPPLE